MTRFPRLAAALLIATSPAALAAQQSPQGQDSAATDDDADAGGTVTTDEIVVTAQPQRGAVIGDIPPEEQLDAGDIRSYGVSSLSELLDELSPETSSGRGRGSERPVVLLNGRRISSFSEIRDLPTEAIERVDILPEEVALKYGYRADQRVVNFVLREHFRAYTGELKDKVPTAGGSNNFEAEANYLRINGDGRFNLDLEAETTSRLLESERDITPAAGRSPYDLFGNVTAADGSGEIDPALSAMAGEPVTIAGVPAGTTMPTLNDFAATANRANQTDTTPYRSLNPATQRVSLNAILSRTIFGDVLATGNIRLEAQNQQSLQGLPGVALTLPAGNPYSPFGDDVTLYRYVAEDDPLMRTSKDFTGHAGLTFNGRLDEWQWSITGNYDRDETRTRNETGVDTGALQALLVAGDPGANPYAALRPPRLADTAHSISTSAGLDGLLTGSPFRLPAGDAHASLKVAADTTDLSSDSVRGGLAQMRKIGRDRGDAKVNLDLPVSSKRNGVLDAIGDLTINGNAEIERLSDFGTLTSYGYGFNWEPIDDVRLLVSVTQEEGAPTAQQLGNPTILTPNARIFDYVTGQTVDIARISGGNPDLRSDNRNVMKIGLNAQPMSDPDLRLSATYMRERIRNPIASFPAATAEIEAAFPDRFVRDGSGTLLQVDSRPINFDRSEREQLRWGINFSKRIQSSRARRFAEGGGSGAGAWRRRREERAGQSSERDDAGQEADREEGEDRGDARQSSSEDRPERAHRGGSGRGGSGHFGGGRGGGRIRVSLYHTIHLLDRIFIRDGVPPLDLLGGSATGSNGGQSRHEVTLRAGYSQDGLGMRFNADWQSATRVDGGATGGDSLRFSDLATFDLRLFADLGQQRSLVRNHRWLRGTRVSLSINNLFDTRQTVTTPDGTVPLSYQPGYVDPLGRTIRISIRKMFF